MTHPPEDLSELASNLKPGAYVVTFTKVHEGSSVIVAVRRASGFEKQ